MLAVVLAGGQGTRLRPLTDQMPKALVPLQGSTLTEHVLRILRRHGVTDVALSVCYRAEDVRRHFGGKWDSVALSYLVEERPRGTAGPLYIMERHVRPFLVVNGDVLAEIDLTAMLRAHQRSGAVATVALTEVEDPSTFGAVQLDGERIVRFVEKPPRGQEPSKWVNAGYYVFSPEIFNCLPQQEFTMLEKDVFPALAAAGKLNGFRSKGQWFDTGTWESYRRAELEWKG